ncbi:MAG: ABC transporter ATP-binding protein [Chitinophagaceae bacterium]|nr:ABC transporter ATP-binding protein [Chitinophagaceae bacterium]
MKEDIKKPLNKERLIKYFEIIKFGMPYKRNFFIGLFVLGCSSFLLMLFPIISGKLIDAVSGKSNWILQDTTSIVLSLFGILFVQGIFSFLRVIFFARFAERSLADIRKKLFHKFTKLPISFYDSHRTGDLISRINSDIASLQDTFTFVLGEIIRQLSILFFGITSIFYYAPSMSIFMLATSPFLIITALVLGKKIKKLSRNNQDLLAENTIIVEETTQAIHIVKSFTNEPFENKRYQQSINALVKNALKASIFRGLFISLIIVIIFSSIFSILWYGAVLVEKGELTIGTLISFVLNTTFIGASIAGLGEMFAQVQKSIGASERVLEILQEPEEAPLQRESIVFIDPSFTDIRFDNVSFEYPTRNDITVLHNIHLEIKTGSKTAIIGTSGSGKSTITSLLMRFYEPTGGKIYLNNIPLNEYSLESIRKSIGIVSQDIVLFGGTLLENIQYGNLHASFEEIENAAKQANAYEFIQSFPDKFHTTVGERGIKLSGGQKQRIAIARAILKNPPILILDEATSSLDSHSEKLIQEALNTITQNRTTIVISHRLASIRNADTILVIEKGNIIEKGTHEQLMSHKNIYHKLVTLQSDRHDTI